LRIVFLGSGAFAIPSFEALLDAGHDVAALVAQPDREKGRGQALAPPPTKPVAERCGVPVLQFARVRALEALQALRELRPELQVVVAFGQILPRPLIDIAPLGTVNVHASLLPLLRGAAPIKWAIAGCQAETGVTTMLIDEGLDTGPILLQRTLAIGAEETAAELSPRLARLGAGLLVETVQGLAERRLAPRPQDHARATIAPMLKKEDGRVDWSRTAAITACRTRGFTPWPGSFCLHDRRLLKLLRVAAVPDHPSVVSPAAEPGVVLSLRPDVIVACGERTRLRLVEVQPESRRPMPASAWAAGARLVPGARLH
jgi:methionyl-tRNA formyltransferase